MRRMTARHMRALEAAQSDLEDSDGQTWDETVEDALTRAWDELLRLGDPGVTV